MAWGGLVRVRLVTDDPIADSSPRAPSGKPAGGGWSLQAQDGTAFRSGHLRADASCVARTVPPTPKRRLDRRQDRASGLVRAPTPHHGPMSHRWRGELDDASARPGVGQRASSHPPMSPRSPRKAAAVERGSRFAGSGHLLGRILMPWRIGTVGWGGRWSRRWGGRVAVPRHASALECRGHVGCGGATEGLANCHDHGGLASGGLACPCGDRGGDDQMVPPLAMPRGVGAGRGALRRRVRTAAIGIGPGAGAPRIAPVCPREGAWLLGRADQAVSGAVPVRCPASVPRCGGRAVSSALWLVPMRPVIGSDTRTCRSPCPSPSGAGGVCHHHDCRGGPAASRCSGWAGSGPERSRLSGDSGFAEVEDRSVWPSRPATDRIWHESRREEILAP